MSTVVDIRNLGVSFSTDAGAVKAVEDVSLSVERGEVLAIVGESGSGKTVTAKTILGLLPETATTKGAVVLSNREGTRQSDVISISKQKLRDIRGTDVAMVFQEPSTALNPVYTVGWQIAEGLQAHGDLSKKEARAKAIEILGRVGIPDPEVRVDHYPHQFSGGQKQRVVIAMALVLDPGLIVADEPTTALDVTVQAEILDLLRRCRDEFGTAIVLITHNMGVVADLADRVAVMYQGNLVEQADVHTLFAAPQADYTKALLAAVPYVGHGTARAAERAAARPTNWTDQPPVVEAKGLEIVYPGRFGRAGFTSGRRRRLRDPARRGARPRRRVRFGQDHHRPRDRRAHQGHGRLAEGAGRRDERHPRAGLPPAPQPHRLRVPGPGVELQPAAHDRGVRRRAAHHPRSGEGCLVGTGAR